MAFLEIESLRLSLRGPAGWHPVLDRVDLELDAGCSLALVGESGCGKSVTAMSIGRLLPEPPLRRDSGSIRVAGRDIFGMDRRTLNSVRGGLVGFVFQDPGAALNPVMRVGEQVREGIRRHAPERATRGEVVSWLGRVGLDDPGNCHDRYPHELSGGMRQRICLAMAMAPGPRLLVADEPTTALDVTIQAQILDLLNRLRRDLGMALLMITHHLAVVERVSERVAVMYAGQIVEEGPVADVLGSPVHPYTAGLLAAVPRPGSGKLPEGIPGRAPGVGSWPSGCRFHPRCGRVEETCRVTSPDELPRGAGGGRVRCPVAVRSGA